MVLRQVAAAHHELQTSEPAVARMHALPNRMIGE
jgi:hypothetical protein